MEQLKPRCDTCPYWDPKDYLDLGICRATPPDQVGDWPETKPSDWCGSHPAMTGKFVEEQYKTLLKDRDDLEWAVT